MTRWDYRWRTTYYKRTDTSGDGVVVWHEYAHLWKPDRVNEVPFPSQAGLDALGAEGFELVTVTTQPVTLLTRTTAQGDSYTAFTTHTLWFKKPVES